MPNHITSASKFLDETFWSFQTSSDHGGLDILALKHNKVYDLSLTKDDISKLSALVKMSPDDFISNLLLFLSNKPVPGGKLYHCILEQPTGDDALTFVWKQKLSGVAELRLASLVVRPASNQNALLGLFQKMVDHQRELQHVVEETQEKLQASESSRESAVQKYKEVVDEMKVREDAYLQRFCAILNSKKRKIRELIESTSSTSSSPKKSRDEKVIKEEGTSGEEDGGGVKGEKASGSRGRGGRQTRGRSTSKR